MNIYQYTVKNINGDDISLSDYKGKVLLIVNTASNCGFTPQLSQLQNIYDMYNEQGFTILGFPCNQFANQEPGTNFEIHGFCNLNYGVTFPLFEKIAVNGQHAHPLFKFLKVQAPGILGTKSIKWNFTKFLVTADGQVFKRYSPNIQPVKLINDIESLL
ncbi:glutathione peroxidase [Bacillus sp. Marseille-P3661]|uniref:glutathione peroxidase n=1 Tax=Bacillus sp. Marseille-P3661 TaxID=1936234 RepID=UPI000C8214C7|nr:glutathione peroxidase [Bacillus sp. Marseille-P3661]